MLEGKEGKRMKNILVISSSPRRNGNSDLLCDEFIKGALEAGNKVEKVFLADKKINVCLGCGACYNTSKCIQKDDMVELNDKMVEADVIVLATPVYFYSMAGQLKVLIDRCEPRWELLIFIFIFYFFCYFMLFLTHMCLFSYNN